MWSASLRRSSQWLLAGGAAPADAYRAIVIGYALIGGVMAIGAMRLGPDIEAPAETIDPTDGIRRRFGLHRSKAVVLKLSVLFSIDAFRKPRLRQHVGCAWRERGRSSR